MAVRIPKLDQVTAWGLAIFTAGFIGATIFTAGTFVNKHSSAQQAIKAKEAAELLENSLKARTSKSTVSSPDITENSDHPNETDQTLNRKEFGYSGQLAPWRWSELHPSWKLCNSGKNQSPIDIAGARTNESLKTLKFNYRHDTNQLSLNQQTFRTRVAQGSWVEIFSDRYDLTSVSFRTPSEHRVNGLPNELEIQLQHQELSGSHANISIQVVPGKESPLLDRIIGSLPRYEGDQTTVERVDWSEILPKKKTYWTYKGSSTEPPCNEGVAWVILTETVQASRKQIDALGKHQKHNARPVQNIGQRKISRSTR
jgi:carbonic anhydrase